MDSDQVLVDRSQQGDTKAFDVLVLKYQQQVFSLIYRLTSDRQAVEDLAQDIFHNAYRAIRHFQGKSSFFTWLYRITVNTCINFTKQQRLRRMITSVEENPYGDVPSPSHEEVDGPERALENKQLAGLIEKALTSISEDKRTILILRDIEGLSYEEIAAIMDCPIGTVRSRLFRAREKIQAKLRAYL